MKVSLDILLKGGENQYTEFKSAGHFANSHQERKPRNNNEVARDIAIALVAFANADGGKLFLGVEDDGTISGTRFSESELDSLRRTTKDLIRGSLPYRIEPIGHLGRTIVVFEVDPQIEVFSLTDGRTPYRNQTQTVWLPADQVAAMKRARTGTLYERLIVREVGLGHLDEQLLERFRKGPGVPEDTTHEQILIDHDLAFRDGENIRLTMGACLLFGRPPMVRFHERCGVNFRRFEGTEVLSGSRSNEVQDIQFEEPLPRLIERTFEHIITQIKISIKLRDLFFEERPEYPTFAWQEAVINAVAHRDYSFRTNGIEIRMFDDRLEIQSIGLPPEPLRIEDLQQRKAMHASRNPRIMRTLKMLGCVRERGEGLSRMFEEMESSCLPVPELRADGQFFVVTFRNTPVFDDKTMQWLRSFPLDKINPRQRRILAKSYQSGKGYFVLREYSDINRVDKETAKKEIRELVDRGIVECVGIRNAAKYYPLLHEGSVEERLKDYFRRHEYLTNKEYRRLFGAISVGEANQRLRKLVEEGILRKEGERRGTRYYPTAKQENNSE